jgi:uncharacterized protein (DUF488 family)
MDRSSEYVIDNVWENKPESLQNEIIELWMSHGVLSQEQAAERIKQVFCVGRDQSGKIAGVGTVYPQFNKQLENSFYYYRSFVAPDHRSNQLATSLLNFTRENMNEAFVKGVNTRCIGMLVEVENEMLKNYWNQAVWPYTGFVYIGKNNRGDHVRINYFDGARIS